MLHSRNPYHNAQIKYLKNDAGEFVPYSVKVFDRKIFKDEGWEERRKYSERVRSCVDEEQKAENAKKAFKLSKDRLFDILMCTKQLDCFVTLTFDNEKVDRNNYNAIVQKLSQWLNNRVRRNALTYILVPEFHKDGSNIHFHGLMNMEALKLVRAVNNNKESPFFGQALCDDKKRPVFNISDYGLGFSTVIKVTGKNGKEACAKYCYKYMNKSGGKKVGGRYYLSGGDIVRPRFELIDAYIESVPAEDIKCGKDGEYGSYRNKVFDEVFSYEGFLFEQVRSENDN